MGKRRFVVVAAAMATAILISSACESGTVARVNNVRTAASASTLPASTVATEAARAHSAAMCTAGSATPSADAEEEYDQETSAAVGELVGRAPLDSSEPDWGARNGAAATQIWAGWKDQPVLTDPNWDDIGVGEYECPDGYLYSTTVLRAAPSMPASGMYSTAQFTAAQVQAFSGLQYGTAVNYQGNTVPLLLDLYTPPAGGGPRPLVILVHGGSFTGGSRTDFGASAREYARRGYAAATIDYRLDPRATNPSYFLLAALNAIDDGIESVRWLRSNATTYSIDADRMGALGSSAGGAITLGMAVVDDPTPTGPLAGVSRSIAAAVSTGAHLTPGIATGAISFDASDAPVMMFHYEEDTATGDTDEYAFETCAAVRAGGNTCDFNVDGGRGHTVSISATGPDWPTEIGPFLWHHLDL